MNCRCADANRKKKEAAADADGGGEAKKKVLGREEKGREQRISCEVGLQLGWMDGWLRSVLPTGQAFSLVYHDGGDD